ncbi:hypothetical protein ACFL6S_23530 [Candidatus Poribacteria bacterium]
MRRIENSRLIKSWKALAHRSPFLSLIVFNTVPLPADPSRFFAIFNRYSVKRYVMAISLGRFVRYFLLAVLGEACRIPNSVLIALTVVLIVSPFLVKKCKKQTHFRGVVENCPHIRADSVTLISGKPLAFSSHGWYPCITGDEKCVAWIPVFTGMTDHTTRHSRENGNP